MAAISPGASASASVPPPPPPAAQPAPQDQALPTPPMPDPQARKADFLSQIAPHAQAVSQATGLDPRLVAAQSALETGWGQNVPSNNYFGIKGEDAGPQQTTEVVNGKPVKTTTSFAGYQSMGDSASGYASLINSNPKYAGLRSAKTLEDQASELQKSGYSTSPKYGKMVLAIAKGIKLPPQVNQQMAENESQ